MTCWSKNRFVASLERTRPCSSPFASSILPESALCGSSLTPSCQLSLLDHCVVVVIVNMVSEKCVVCGKSRLAISNFLFLLRSCFLCYFCAEPCCFKNNCHALPLFPSFRFFPHVRPSSLLCTIDLPFSPIFFFFEFCRQSSRFDFSSLFPRFPLPSLLEKTVYPMVFLCRSKTFPIPNSLFFFHFSVFTNFVGEDLCRGQASSREVLQVRLVIFSFFRSYISGASTARIV